MQETREKVNNDAVFKYNYKVMLGAVLQRGRAKYGDFQLYATK